MAVASLTLAVSVSSSKPLQDKPAPIRIVLIGADDTINIESVSSEELNKAWRVNASGDLNLPLVGKIHAEGLTVEQLESEISKRLKKYVVDPQVTAYVSETRSQPVVVTGAVATPGTFQLAGHRTLLDMLVQAGGPKDAGATLTLRRDAQFGALTGPGVRVEQDGKYSVREVKLEDVLGGHSSVADIPIKPYDVISVSRHEAKNVYIMGEVNKPGTVELVTSDQMPLSTLVAMAGGLTHQASAKKARIMASGGADNRRMVSEVNIKNIIDGRSPDVDLHPGDIVVVPSNQVRVYMQALSMSLMTTPVYLLGRF
jgi:polysaccharide export outer membrane protein